jgi:hypothetical protein
MSISKDVGTTLGGWFFILDDYLYSLKDTANDYNSPIYYKTLANLLRMSYLCSINLQFKHTLPSVLPRLNAYFCAIEVRLMHVCCTFINRTTIEQQTDNNRTTVGVGAKVELR